MTNWIWKIASKNPYLARVVEISFYWAILSILQYAWDSLISWSFENFKVALGMFLTAFVAWIISWIQTYFRRKKEKIEEEIESS